MKDKLQKISSYVSGYGLRVYEIVQYNKNADSWYIVGDCSTDKQYIEGQIALHNMKLQ